MTQTTLSGAFVLVLDVGTSGLRAALVDNAGRVVDYEYVANPPSTPFPGLVEFDAIEMYEKCIAVLTCVVERNGEATIAGLGISNQRASTVAWHATTGTPFGPGIGWQDLRTVMECITAKSEHDIHLAPNQTATKAAWLIQNAIGDATPSDIRIGTIDAWLTWKLTNSEAFVTDHTNAAVTGLVDVSTVDWDPSICATLGIPIESLPRIVATSEIVGPVSGHGALNGIVIAARVGDQQASLVGQGCISPGATKITFGTGGMLDMVTGSVGPTEARRTPHGTFPIVAYSVAEPTREICWGIEAVMLSAGTNIEWLCDDMGLIESPSHSATLAASVDSCDGVTYVPALLGVGTPDWDYGARGTLTGLTRGTTAAHIVRAVLDGIAHRGADLFSAAIADADERRVAPPTEVRIDGGMSNNPIFVDLLADAVGLPVAVSAVAEATTLGAAFLAGTAVGLWPNLAAAAKTASATRVVNPSMEPDVRRARRAEWARSLAGARAWIPALSALDF